MKKYTNKQIVEYTETLFFIAAVIGVMGSVLCGAITVDETHNLYSLMNVTAVLITYFIVLETCFIITLFHMNEFKISTVLYLKFLYGLILFYPSALLFYLFIWLWDLIKNLGNIFNFLFNVFMNMLIWWSQNLIVLYWTIGIILFITINVIIAKLLIGRK